MSGEKIIKKNWYAFYTKPRHEFKAATQLESIGMEYYLPTITRLKQWSDRKKKVTEPIMRSYIFIKCDERGRHNALQQKQIVSTVSFGGVPAIIPDWQIENLRKLLEYNPKVFISNVLEAGTRVKIMDGPFSGVEGIVCYHQKERTLAVTIETLHRSIMVILPPESVIKKVDS